MHLYEISSRMRELLDKEELTEQESAELDLLSENLDVKVDSVCSVVKESELEAEALEGESVRLKDKAESLRKKKERLKDYLMRCLNEAGQKSHKAKYHDVRIQKSPPKVEALVEMDKISPWLVKKQTKVTITLNRDVILSAYEESGVSPPGIKVTEGEHLRIV